NMTLLLEEEVRQVLDFLNRTLQKSMDNMTDEVKAYWESAQAELIEIRESETLEAMLPLLSSKLKQLLPLCIDHQYSKTNSQLLFDIRSYIETHFNSPDLSLDHIGEKFKINGKYCSQLFKRQ